MKTLTFYIVSLLLISCNGMKDISEIKDEDTMTVCLLSNEVYNADSQDTAKEYLERRQVVRKLVLEGDQRASLLKEFLNDSNYEPLSRKCKFEPVYALLVNDKLLALFDVEYCPTIEYVNKEKDSKYIGITAENTLKKLLEDYLK
ncbi:hypothetical protein H2O64_15485 [Kordia sp. YSTF-M3]|uniref:DUF302 domain-containing protein n=1 Tax=Kordia aestuariivivens TaxID=2759037 RepID=A0ABR7QCK7_9FLAO|nr:hypothetical protein [Kordia aestuariivivens]MBC8756079.1 hypothetical protein [Kordia aestuariivivens]